MEQSTDESSLTVPYNSSARRDSDVNLYDVNDGYFHKMEILPTPE